MCIHAPSITITTCQKSHLAAGRHAETPKGKKKKKHAALGIVPGKHTVPVGLRKERALLSAEPAPPEPDPIPVAHTKRC